MREYLSYSPIQTQQIAGEIAGFLHPGDVIAFRGGLGSGKTTFTRGLAQGLGLNADDVVSPTFSLVNEYPGNGFSLCHFDMYRVETFEDLYSTGFYDYLDASHILAIEWSENIASVLPDNCITIEFSGTPDSDMRKITVRGGPF